MIKRLEKQEKDQNYQSSSLKPQKIPLSEDIQDRKQYFTSYSDFNNDKRNSPRTDSKIFDSLNTNLNDILNDEKEIL